MAREAPDDMAYLSLGNAYKEAGRHEDAAHAFQQAIERNPQMSRAYQLAGQCLLQLDQTQEAQAILEKGYVIAAERGDVMPQKAIGALLTEKLGRPLPQVQTPASNDASASDAPQGDTLADRRTGQQQQRLPDPPMRGPTGQFIYDHFGADTWHAWIGQGTKVINELRLDFSDPQHQATYEQYMLEWLEVTPDEIETYAKQHPQASS